MPFTTVLSNCGIAIYAAYELVLRRRREAEAATWKGDGDDRSSTRLILGAYLVTVAINIAFGRGSTGTIGPALRWVGVALMAAGLGVRAWAMATLGRYYTRTLRTVDDQQLVDRGPYRLIRHPGYSGSLLVWVGYALGLGNWIAALLTAALLGGVYLWRINAEEDLLRSSFGPNYTGYQRRTKRLVPYLY